MSKIARAPGGSKIFMHSKLELMLCTELIQKFLLFELETTTLRWVVETSYKSGCLVLAGHQWTLQ